MEPAMKYLWGKCIGSASATGIVLSEKGPLRLMGNFLSAK